MAATTEPGPTPDTPAPELTSGEMTLLDHLQELRSRVTWAAGAVVVGMAIFFVPPIGFATIEFLLEPAEQNPDFEAQAITPLENLVTYFRVALMGGIALGMPMLVYQTLRFITPALTPEEKRWTYPLVIAASLSFFGGMAFAYWIVLPPAYAFLFDFGSSFAKPTPTITSYMDLTIRLIGILGFVFELPHHRHGPRPHAHRPLAAAARLVAVRDHRRLRRLRHRHPDHRSRHAIARRRPPWSCSTSSASASPGSSARGASAVPQPTAPA